MKIKDILTEGSTDLVARFYRDQNSDFDQSFNVEADEIRQKNASYYSTYFKEFAESGVTPVFTNSDNHVADNKAKWDNEPKVDAPQTAGYRGKQRALARAGLPHNTPQRFDPRIKPQSDLEQ